MADHKDYREAVRAKMLADGQLVTLLGGGSPAPVFYLRKRSNLTVPQVTFFDSGTMPDRLVPLHERMMRFEGHAKTVETASSIIARIRALFNRQPLTIQGTGWRFMGMYANDDSEEIVEDGDIFTVASTFLMLLYETG